MLSLNFIKSYIGALRDYTLLKEEVKKSFALPFSQIKNKDYPSTFVTQPSKQIKFDKEFVSRMRNITHKEIVVSAHWEDMYQIGDKKNFNKNLLEMNDDEFFNQVANPSKNNLHYGFGDICKYVLDKQNCL